MGLRLHLACVLLLLATAAAASPPAPGSGVLRVGISGDYAPFSARRGEDSQDFEGFDIAVARAYAEERGLALELVPFRWPALLENLTAKRFDVAMSGITVRPRRAVAGRFTVAVVESGAVVLARHPSRWSELEDLDRRVVRIGVNAGGHLEQVARDRFRRATLVSIPDTASVKKALDSHDVDAVVTDVFEAPLWRQQDPQLAVLGPFTRDRKAYLVRADRPGLARDLDGWLIERERDGSLAQLRARYLGGGAPTATPLAALLAALDERLALMPLVGSAKRRAGLPLEVPAREALVLDAALVSVRKAASRAHREPPPALPVRAVFRAQLDAAKGVQWAAARDPAWEPGDSIPDLDGALRPALLRIGDRIAALLVALPPDLEPAAVRAAARDALRSRWLSEASAWRIADAIIRCSKAPREDEGVQLPGGS